MDPKKITLDQVIDIPTAAERYNISDAYLRSLVKKNRIESFNVGRNVLILTSSVEQYAQDRFEAPDGHVTIAEAAKIVGVTTQTIHHWIKTGHIEGHAHGNGKRNRWTVVRSSLEGKKKRSPGRPSNKPEQLTLFDVSAYDNDKALHPVE